MKHVGDFMGSLAVATQDIEANDIKQHHLKVAKLEACGVRAIDADEEAEAGNDDNDADEVSEIVTPQEKQRAQSKLITVVKKIEALKAKHPDGMRVGEVPELLLQVRKRMLTKDVGALLDTIMQYAHTDDKFLTTLVKLIPVRSVLTICALPLPLLTDRFVRRVVRSCCKNTSRT